MNKILEKLDKIAQSLEDMGRVRLANNIDIISNTLEKLSGFSKYLKTPQEITKELEGQTIVFFDTETTGLDAKNDQIVEIAAVAVHGPNLDIIDEFHEKIDLTSKTKEKQKNEQDNPSEDPNAWTVDKALQFNKYHELDKEPKDETNVLEDFKVFVEKHNPYLVAQNAEFDMKFVGSRVGAPKNKGVYDTMLFSRLMFIPSLKALEAQGDERAQEIISALTNSKGKMSSRLGDLLGALGVEIQNWHTALGDAQSTVQLYKGLISYLVDNSPGIEDPNYKQELGKALNRQRELRNKTKGAR